MRNLGPCRFRGATGVGAIADNDYYQPECSCQHDKNYNGKNQHLLSAETKWQRSDSISPSIKI
jgi:hypothetical protein